MMPPPGFTSAFPVVESRLPNIMPGVGPPAAGYGMNSSAPAARPQLAQQQTPAPRIVRGQRPDEPVRPSPAAPVRPPALRMPSPEELGVAVVPRPENLSVDWTAAHVQLDRLGATCFHLERLPKGGCRITCLLPTKQSDRTHRIEAEAASDADAIRLALAQAERWAAGTK